MNATGFGCPVACLYTLVSLFRRFAGLESGKLGLGVFINFHVLQQQSQIPQLLTSSF